MRVYKCVLTALVAVVLCAGVQVEAQSSAASGLTLAGRLLNSLSGDPIPGAVVLIEELRRQATSAPDGTFSLAGVPPGTYHLSVKADGYSSRRTEVTAAAAAAPITVAVDPELHFEDVVSVGPEARSQFDSLQPTSVLSGQELTKQLAGSLGQTLENQSGVTSRSFGPAPARPVIRGLDGDRVLILQDGQRMGDLSSQSGDHGVAINPAAAQRIEVVRGPATLLYGANAIGGLVNVITNDIPMQPAMGVHGTTTVDLGSAASEAGGAADVLIGNGRVALHAGGGGRRSGDVDTPLGTVDNSQSRNGFGNVGLSWTGAKGYFGGSYGYDDTKYGIPVVEDGQVELTPRRHAFSLRGGGQNLSGAFDSFRGTLAMRRYKHEELAGGQVDTAFTNNSTEAELMGSHRAIGRLKGSLGAWYLDRAFDARGEEALSPAVDQRGAAAFVYEELTWPHVTVQFGGRVDHTRYAPQGENERSFTSGSGSLGVLLRPAGADDRLTVALSLARAARNPALEELFYFGTHAGNFAFEVGNPELRPEHALGFDASLRWRGPRASGEVTYFRNDVRDFVFRRQMSEEAFASRLAAFDARFPGRDVLSASPEAEFPIVENVAADSVLQGVEAHSDIQINSAFATEVGLDYVRGSVRDTGEFLPRLPPLRLRAGLRYQHNAFQAGGEAAAVLKQDRVSGLETPTDGYGLLKFFAVYSVQSGSTLHTITARLDNATNELYRSHLSLIKDLVPEMGRNFRLLYGMKF
jgi:iron complex outermembrane receptor protein